MDITPLGRYIKTTADADDFRHTLDNLGDSLYKTDHTAEAAIHNLIPYDQAAFIAKLAAQHTVNMDNKADVQKFLGELRDAITALPVVQISLAFSPKAKVIGLIHDWFYRTFRKMVILDIIVKPDLLAGSIISYNGKYYDYSLGKETENFWNKPGRNEQHTYG